MQNNRVSLLPKEYKLQLSKRKKLYKLKNIFLAVFLVIASIFLVFSLILLGSKRTLSKLNSENNLVLEEISSLKEYEIKNNQLNSLFDRINKAESNDSYLLLKFEKLVDALPQGVWIDKFKLTAEEEGEKLSVDLGAGTYEQVSETISSFEETKLFNTLSVTKTANDHNGVRFSLELFLDEDFVFEEAEEPQETEENQDQETGEAENEKA